MPITIGCSTMNVLDWGLLDLYATHIAMGVWFMGAGAYAYYSLRDFFTVDKDAT